jgi:hypothetical protein
MPFSRADLNGVPRSLLGISDGTRRLVKVWTRPQFRGAASKENDMNNDNTTKQQITRAVTRIGCIAALGMALTCALPSTAHAQIVIPPVPPGLEVPAGNEAFLLGHGVGTQNYECQPVASLGRVAWTLFTPQATLFDDQGEQLITHFSSPNPAEGGIVRVSWQDSQDTSSVWAQGTAFATVPNAIPAVRLEVIGRQVGPNGGNTLFGTTFIQRLDTKGGLAPSTGCDLLTDVGHRAFISYTAEYVFYRQN